jgi:phthiocerol/phenolphthiocerol synthesis type-I polyketide synthase E
VIEEFVLGRVEGDVVAPAAPALPGLIGIRPADGAEALHRVLAAGAGPQVVVSARSLDRILADARRLDAAAVEAQMTPTGEVLERIAGRAHVAPRTELEATVARIWGDLLGVGRIGVEDEFFELGGNSLVAVQLIGRIRAATGVRLPMQALFETPTVAGMAELVERLRAEGSAAPATPIRRLERRG